MQTELFAAEHAWLERKYAALLSELQDVNGQINQLTPNVDIGRLCAIRSRIWGEVTHIVELMDWTDPARTHGRPTLGQLEEWIAKRRGTAPATNRNPYELEDANAT